MKTRLKKIDEDPDYADERQALEDYADLLNQQTDAKARLKAAQEDLDAKLDAKYPQLSEAEIKALVVDDKWLAALDAAIHGEMDRVSQQLTQRAKELAERYETPRPQMVNRVADLEAKVNRHLEKMGFSQGTMRDLLTGKKRLPGFTGEWEVVRSGDIGRFRGGSGFPYQVPRRHLR